MSNIKITFKDGTTKEFKHQGRAGGSYTKRAIYKEGFVIIEDEWYRQTVFPADTIKEVFEEPHRG